MSRKWVDMTDPWVFLRSFCDDADTVAIGLRREFPDVHDLFERCVNHIRHREMNIMYLRTLSWNTMHKISPSDWRRFRCRALWVNAFRMEKRNRYIESVCSADQQRGLFALKLAVHLVLQRRRDYFCMMRPLKRAFDELVQEICGNK